jgi:hypothetical protein
MCQHRAFEQRHGVGRGRCLGSFDALSNGPVCAGRTWQANAELAESYDKFLSFSVFCTARTGKEAALERLASQFQKKLLLVITGNEETHQLAKRVGDLSINNNNPK